MGKPSVPVQKRLFAVSGNRCSFRECKQTLVDKPSGKVTGRICHIKGNQPNSKRHDPNQSEAERQGFGNLLVMCPIHHDVIDTDDKVYTVEVLHTLKAEHEAKHENDAPPAEETVTLFINNVSFDVPDGSVILSANQSGGQVAHTINNNYGSNPPVQSPFRAELAKRHLADTEDPDFARTVYHKKLGWARKREFTPLKTTALLFAHFPKCIYDASSEDELRAWADTNKLRFEPCKHYPFIMGVYPSLIGSAWVWGETGMNDGHPGVVAYSRYMALERTGWLEYGFCPHSPGEDESHIYYAKTLGHIYGFLGFVKQLCEFRGIDLDAVSLGMGMRGLRGKSLECIAEIGIREFWSVTPPEKDTLLMHRPSEDGEWTLDSVTKEFADNLLNHWEFARPGHFTATPEFKGSTYQGEFFRKSFHYW